MGTATLLATLTGCSSHEVKAVPEVPERICWDVFTRQDVTPLLPSGDKATISIDPFVLREELDGTTCTLDVDGQTRFQAGATRRDFEDDIEWSSYEKGKTAPIEVGKKGLVWPGGVVTYIVCEPPKSPSVPGNYIELDISTFDVADDKLPSRTLTPLLKRFVTFAERELNCV
ncbi:hypothetical protein ABZ802_29395 [Streptomyces sp. NPDC047737]|uniref:hypothetical protein n=1 Tax=unclassified Streptomyces TaxID=2593676 RepID=UPI0033E02E4C